MSFSPDAPASRTTAPPEADPPPGIDGHGPGQLGLVGGGAPVVVQSMTNTDTADVDATVAQVALARTGSKSSASRSIATRRLPLCRRSANAWTGSASAFLSWAISYIGHKLLEDHRGRGGLSTNTGSIPVSASRKKKDRQFGAIVEMALRYGRSHPHRRELGIARPELPDPPHGRRRGRNTR